MKTPLSPILLSLLLLGSPALLPGQAKAGGRHVIVLGAHPRVLDSSGGLRLPRLGERQGPLLFRFGYTFKGERFDNLAELELGPARPRSTQVLTPIASALPELHVADLGAFTAVRARYGALVPLWVSRAPALRVALRGGTGVDLDVQQLHPSPGRVRSGSTLGVISADLLAELGVELTRRHTFSLSAALPALAWVSRSSSLRGPSPALSPGKAPGRLRALLRFLGEGRPESWSTLQALRLRAVHLWQPAPSWGVLASVELRVLRERDPSPLLLLEYGLGVGVQATF